MKLPEIPLPEPEFMITLPRGKAKSRRLEVTALRFLLRAVPSCTADYVLATADGGRHSFWMTLGAAFAVLAFAVLLVGVREGDGETEDLP